MAISARTRRNGLWVTCIVIVLGAAAYLATILLRPGLPTPTELTSKAKAQAALTGGAAVYAKRCGYCHDTGFGPAIGGRDLPAEAVASFVRTGPGAMPSFTPAQISDDDVAAVTAYVNGLLAKADDGK